MLVRSVSPPGVVLLKGTQVALTRHTSGASDRTNPRVLRRTAVAPRYKGSYASCSGDVGHS